MQIHSPVRLIGALAFILPRRQPRLQCRSSRERIIGHHPVSPHEAVRV